MTRTERTYYLVFGLYCSSWSFLGPIYPLFLLSRGLDLFQINVVLAMYLITSFLFEVPTGALADLVGRKVSFLLSCVIRMGAFTLYAFADSFVDCVVAEFIDALGTTLANGALDAWAVDGMWTEGNRSPAARFFARAQMIARVLMIASGVTSGYLAERDLALPWFVAAAGFAVTALVALAVMREPRRAAARDWRGMHRSLGRTARAGLATVRRAPVLLLLCLLTMAGAFGAMPVNMLWPPRMQALTGEGTWLMGWIWAFLNVTALVGSALIPRLLARFRRERVLCAAALWRAGTLALVGAATGAGPALAGLLLQEVSFGLTEPLVQAWMNEHIAAEQRATVLSVRAMSFMLGGAAGLVCIGVLARDTGLPAAWIACAAVFALLAPGFVVLGRLARGAETEAASRRVEAAATQ
jgi:MFS family permease